MMAPTGVLTMRNITLIAYLLIMFSGLLQAQNQIEKKRPTQISQNAQGIAINGYDPVAFFTERKAIQGTEVYSCQWNDATWYFASEENRQLFLNDPKGYAPQYGGYCAHAVTRGQLVESDPQSFAIKDDKLYLFRDEQSKTKALFKFAKKKHKTERNWLTFTSRF